MKRNLKFNPDRRFIIPTTEDRHEFVVHGTPDFHMSIHYAHVRGLYSHWHDELEMVLLTQGEARFLVGKEEFPAKAGDILIVQPGVLHSASGIDKSLFEFYAIMVHFEFLSSVGCDDIQRKYVLPIFCKRLAYPALITAEMDREQKLTGILRSIIDIYEMGENDYELLVKAKFYEAFYHLAKYSSLYPQAADYKDSPMHSFAWVRVFLQYIQENYNRHITLSDMANQAAMSEGHFCRTVKRTFGVSPVDFLNNYRLNQAVRLIESTNRNFGDISEATGFRNVNRFTATFKNVFKCTPITYRRRLRAESAAALDTAAI
jgi:AraC-like DNA-binding protein/mannose-6-phosphate isomerase-like protein (cupin superfamily)